MATRTLLRKRDVCKRYGGVTPRTIERAVEAGRIPRPQYPFANGIPFWDEAELQTNERAAAMAGRDAAAWKIRLFFELGAATTRKECREILSQFDEQTGGLPTREHDALSEQITSVIAKNLRSEKGPEGIRAS